MDQRTFEHLMAKARTFITVGDGVDYWTGYQRGLRRRFHGEDFGTDAEHELYMGLVEDRDPGRAARGRGYRDAYQGDGIW
jgi:hypothetical protein